MLKIAPLLLILVLALVNFSAYGAEPSLEVIVEEHDNVQVVIREETMPIVEDNVNEAETSTDMSAEASVENEEMLTEDGAMALSHSGRTPLEKVRDVEDYLVALSDAYEIVAPKAWQVLVEQKKYEAVANPILPVSLLIFVIAAHVYIRKHWSRESVYAPENGQSVDLSDLDEALALYYLFVFVIPTIVAFAALIWSAVAIGDSIKLFNAPGSYVIQDLMNRM